MKNDLDKTLENILGLIDKDIHIISINYIGVQLDSHTASTLAKYAATLSGMKSDRQKEVKKERADLDKLSTAELIELYNKKDKE